MPLGDGDKILNDIFQKRTGMSIDEHNARTRENNYQNRKIEENLKTWDSYKRLDSIKKKAIEITRKDDSIKKLNWKVNTLNSRIDSLNALNQSKYSFNFYSSSGKQYFAIFTIFLIIVLVSIRKIRKG
jgi:hypothetical protein